MTVLLDFSYLHTLFGQKHCSIAFQKMFEDKTEYACCDMICESGSWWNQWTLHDFWWFEGLQKIPVQMYIKPFPHIKCWCSIQWTIFVVYTMPSTLVSSCGAICATIWCFTTSIYNGTAAGKARICSIWLCYIVSMIQQIRDYFQVREKIWTVKAIQ